MSKVSLYVISYTYMTKSCLGAGHFSLHHMPKNICLLYVWLFCLMATVSKLGLKNWFKFFYEVFYLKDFIKLFKIAETKELEKKKRLKE